MFNFAVAGALERYHPIQRKPAIQPVDPVNRAAEVQSITAEGLSSKFAQETLLQPNTKSDRLRAYGAGAQGAEPRQRRRAWTVADLMTKPVKTMSPEETIAVAWSILEKTGFRHIPIVNVLKQVEGLVSDRDLLRLSKGQKEDSAPISSIMTKRVLTCFPETSLRLAAHTMLEEGFSSLPVVDSQGILLGILTTGDILKGLVNEAPVDLWA